MKVYCDMDGVLVDLESYWLERYNLDFDDNLKIEDLTDYDFTKFVKSPNVFLNYLKESGFHGPERKPLGDSIEIFTKIYSEVANLFILTSPYKNSETCIRDKKEWVKKYLSFFPPEDMIFCHHKHLLSRPGDVLLDDKPTSLKRWSSNGGISVCYKRRWNDNSGANYEVKGWHDFYWLLERIKEGTADIQL